MTQLLNKFSIFNTVANELKQQIKYFYIFVHFRRNVIFITSDDKVFGFGDNYWGCLGLGHENEVKEPQIINELCFKKIIQIYNGMEFALALTEENEIYSWGRNDGQLGRECSFNLRNGCKPQKIEIFCGIIIIQISC